jgi:hypothetical protein
VVLLNNFVSFKAFYRREGAIFQAGTLYLDGRSCELTVQVQDTARHAVLAGLAKTCLAYCDCTRQGQKMSIVAAFTAGDIDFLFVGRNGVFYDRQGRDWDATITKLIENPTSVAQAFFAPYKKFVRVIEEQVAKRAAAQRGGGPGHADELCDQAHDRRPDRSRRAAKVPTAVPRTAGRVDVGTVAAIGVALGSISAVLVAVFGKFVDLGQWIPVALWASCGDLRAEHADRLAQAAPAQPGADPGRERLGHQRAHEGQCAAGRHAVADRACAAGRAGGSRATRTASGTAPPALPRRPCWRWPRGAGLAHGLAGRPAAHGAAAWADGGGGRCANAQRLS